MKRLLVILDLNGVLMSRVRKESLPLAQRNPTLPSHVDFTVRGSRIYKRPHLSGFLQGLSRLCDLGTWTSAGGRNESIMLSNLLEHNVRERALFHWNREKCDLVYAPRAEDGQQVVGETSDAGSLDLKRPKVDVSISMHI